METTDRRFGVAETNALFRSFSFEMESRMPPSVPYDEAVTDDLAIAIVERRKTEDFEAQESAKWRQFFDPWTPTSDPDMKTLDDQGSALNEAWTQFKAKLPPEDQIDFSKGPQNFEHVIKIIQKVEDDWQRKKKKGFMGLTKIRFRKVCTTLASHSTLLEVLPSGSQYASVFCGTLQTLIKASANYENIAEGLSKSLLGITEAAEACVRECSLYPTEMFKHNVANLYAHIFLFLRDTLDWYTKKSIRRVLSSLHEDFYEHFEDQISNIKSISLEIGRMAQHASQSELRSVRLQVEDVRKNQRLAQEKAHREAADRQYQRQKKIEKRRMEAENTRRLEQERWGRFDVLVGSFKRICVEEVYKALADERSGRHGMIEERGFGSQVASKSSRDGEQCALEEYEQREDIQYDSRDLEDFFDREAIMIDRDEAAVLFVQWAVVAALQEWTMAVGSEMLCIVGPSPGPSPSTTSLIAAKYAASASHAKLPVISFFCKPSYRNVPHGSTPEAEALISLTYALIRQLIELLPSVLGPNRRFQRQRFEALDGSLDSWNDAVAILNDLLDVSPPVLFCVIDGFEQLDDTSTQKCMGELIEALRGDSITNKDSAGSKRILKVLFTTAGRSKCLLTNLEESELVFAEQSSAGRRQGKPLPGRRALSPTAFLSSIEASKLDGS